MQLFYGTFEKIYLAFANIYFVETIVLCEFSTLLSWQRKSLVFLSFISTICIKRKFVSEGLRDGIIAQTLRFIEFLNRKLESVK